MTPVNPVIVSGTHPHQILTVFWTIRMGMDNKTSMSFITLFIREDPVGTHEDFNLVDEVINRFL